ncbi:MAG: hypothetical protein AB1646_12810 [Thermodesulfobacteriota bacterium]
MKYEVTDQSITGISEEDDFARIVRRRAEQEGFPRGRTIICSEEGGCRLVRDPDAQRRREEDE